MKLGDTIQIRQMTVSLMSARSYYGRHATGAVLLINWSVRFHGSAKDAKKIIASLMKAP